MSDDDRGPAPGVYSPDQLQPYVQRLVHLPGTRLTPEVVLHRTLDKLAHIKALTIVIQWHNDEFATDWSQQKVSELAMASITLDEAMRGVVSGREPPS